LDGFEQWLSQNPMTIYYELFTPIIHYLTPSQLKSFDGTTHVISENTLIPTMTTKILTNTYANVSNVNSTAYSLRRGVNNVAETSAIINETDVEQDDVLDVTMCAIDELYSMLEPNLE
jgi:prephenate dehydratase